MFVIGVGIPQRHPGAELTGLAEAPQVGRDDDLHGFLMQAEASECATLAGSSLGDDIVAAQQLDLIGGEQRLGQQLQERWPAAWPPRTAAATAGDAGQSPSARIPSIV